MTKKRLTLSFDGLLRATFAPNVPLTVEEMARVLLHDLHPRIDDTTTDNPSNRPGQPEVVEPDLDRPPASYRLREWDGEPRFTTARWAGAPIACLLPPSDELPSDRQTDSREGH